MNNQHTPIALIIPKGDNIRTVVMHWSERFGKCLDCGLPAAYDLDIIERSDLGVMRLCSVCASYNVAAGNGDRLTYLFPED